MEHTAVWLEMLNLGDILEQLPTCFLHLLMLSLLGCNWLHLAVQQIDELAIFAEVFFLQSNASLELDVALD